MDVRYEFQLVGSRNIELHAPVMVLDGDDVLQETTHFVRDVSYFTTDYRTVLKLREEPGMFKLITPEPAVTEDKTVDPPVPDSKKAPVMDDKQNGKADDAKTDGDK